MIDEAHLDPVSIFNGIERFAKAHDERIKRQRSLLSALK